MAFVITLMIAFGLASLWWLARQGVLSKPWLEQGLAGAGAGADGRSGLTDLPAAKVGLGVFLAVVVSLFTLLASAYAVRMNYSDWQRLPLPGLVWLNTLVLASSSAALHWARVGVRRERLEEVKSGLLAGGLLALVFILGQIIAWRQLTGSGYLVTTNPSDSFFYLITGLHAAHIGGGLIALGRAGIRAWGPDARAGGGPARLRLGIELCSTYWHVLFAIWLVMLLLMTGWADEFAAICGRLLT